MPFQQASELKGRQALPFRINVWGEQKTGKTSFALSFPRPMWFFNFDLGLQELLEKRPELAEGLEVATYLLPPNATLEQGEEVLQSFVDDWYAALESPGGTMVLDTGTQLKELATFVKMQQKLDEKVKRAAALAAQKKTPFDPDAVQLMRPDYAARNSFINAVLSLPSLVPEKNVVYLWKAKEMYSGNGQPTGQYTGDLFKDAPYIAQGTFARKRYGLGKNVSFSTVVEDWREDPTMNGEEFTEDVVSGYQDLREILR